jgi:hypothetical protein
MSSDVNVHFVLPVDSPVTPEEAEHLDVDRDWTLFADGIFAWILQTYVILRQRARLAVSIGFELRPDAVNMVHASQLANCRPRPATFVVCVRADYRTVSWARLHIVQNQRQARLSSLWVPHWPQPGLIPRCRDRREVKTVAFAGRGYYIAGRESDWEKELARIGCILKVLSSDRWNDLSNIDILLAIRSFDDRTWDTKPPSKLINAWVARIPLIAGADSAYGQIGRPGIDYVRVHSMSEAVEWIQVLRRERDRYGAIVTAGEERAIAFTRDAIAMSWETLLGDRVVRDFINWRARQGVGTKISGTLSGSLFYSWQRLRNCMPARVRRALNPNFPR